MGLGVVQDEVYMDQKEDTTNYDEGAKMGTKMRPENNINKGSTTDLNIISLSFGSPGSQGRRCCRSGENAGEIVVVRVVCRMCKKEREGILVRYVLAAPVLPHTH